MSDQLHKVIGIDLGTTYSAVAVYDTYNEEARIILDKSERNNETTPSVVSLEATSKKVIVGYPAKSNLAVHPEHTIIEIKREMGEFFRPETLVKYNAQNLFSAERDPVKVFFTGQWLLPQEISAFTLMKMKEIAEKEIGEEIRDAVVTVPAYFTEKQKKATEEAALLAGLYPRQLIPEPTAAAICYGVDKMEAEKKIYLVYDLGGGTFDVSIIRVEEENVSVIATSGDPRLGGGDFDDAITTWAINELLQQFGIDVRNDALAHARIKEQAELAKIALSSYPETVLVLPFLNPQNPPRLPITRPLFEKLIEDLLAKSKTYVDKAIELAASQKSVQRDDIDAILLVGGSSKIPIIRNMLLDYFGKDESFVRTEVNPDAVVARGAAILAYRFAPTPPPFDIRKKNQSTLVNTEVEDELQVNLITEHSLGIGVQDNLVHKIVDQGTSIPIERKEGGFTNGGPTDSIPVLVYQGEGKYTYDNTLIGTLHIGPMEPKPAGFHQFEVIFKLDVNGLLTMMLIHLNEGKTYEATFEQKTGVGGEDALVAIRNKLLKLYSPSGVSPQTPGIPQPGAPVPQPVPVPVPPPVQPGSQVPPPQPGAAMPTPSPDGMPGYSQPGTVPQPQAGVTPPQPGTIPQPPPGVTPPPTQAGTQVPPSQPETPIPTPQPSEMPEAPQPGTIPQPPSGVTPPPTQAGTQVPPPQPETPIPTPQPGEMSGAPQPGTVPQPPPDAPVPSVQLSQQQKGGQIEGLIEPVVEIPAQFKQIVRRSKKQLLKKFDPDLLAAFNAFTQALNTGCSEEELEDIGDDLADAYDDARH